jgi:Protein of unknown function (DUF2971)
MFSTTAFGARLSGNVGRQDSVTYTFDPRTTFILSHSGQSSNSRAGIAKVEPTSTVPYTTDPFLPPNDEIPVWRYVAFHKLLWAIRQKKLWLTLLDVFRRNGDPYEASVPRATKDADFLLGNSGTNFLATNFPSSGSSVGPCPQEAQRRDFQTWISRKRRALLRAAHASCWRYGEESEAMWRLYCDPHVGVAMRSTSAKLRDSVRDPHAIISPVKYIDYSAESFGRHVHDYDPALHKRVAFKHEQEVRVLRVRKDDFTQAENDETFTTADHLEIDWDPEFVIDQIVVGPQCPEDYVNIFKEAIDRLSPLLASRVIRSTLVEAPLY